VFFHVVVLILFAGGVSPQEARRGRAFVLPAMLCHILSLAWQAGRLSPYKPVVLMVAQVTISAHNSQPQSPSFLQTCGNYWAFGLIKVR